MNNNVNEPRTMIEEFYQFGIIIVLFGFIILRDCPITREKKLEVYRYNMIAYGRY